MNFRYLIFVFLSTLVFGSCSDNLKNSETNQIISSKSISKIVNNEDLVWVIEKEDTIF